MRRTDKDDGRVVAPMNVEGMPWYKKAPDIPTGPNARPPSRKELLRTALTATLAGLIAVAIFTAAGALFVLFCTNVWLK